MKSGNRPAINTLTLDRNPAIRHWSKTKELEWLIKCVSFKHTRCLPTGHWGALFFIGNVAVCSYL